MFFPILSWSFWVATSQPSLTPERSSEIPQQKPMTDYLGHFGRSLLNSKEPHWSLVKADSKWKRNHTSPERCRDLAFPSLRFNTKANPGRFFCRFIGICPVHLICQASELQDQYLSTTAKDTPIYLKRTNTPVRRRITPFRRQITLFRAVAKAV